MFSVLSGVQARLRYPGGVTALPGTFSLPLMYRQKQYVSTAFFGLDVYFFRRYNGGMAKKKPKPKIGRPPKLPESTKSRYLQVRVQESEREGFAAAAELRGLDVSAWVRTVLRDAARKELRDNGSLVPFLDRR
jgi:hypothetical protein